MMWGYGHGMGVWGYTYLTLSTAAFVIVAVAVVLVLLRGGGRERPAAIGRPPESVLADRLARGEIDEAEYRSRLSALREGPAPSSR